MVRFGNNEVIKTLTKTLTFVDADANANSDAAADAEGSTIPLRERCSGELKTKGLQQDFVSHSELCLAAQCEFLDF